VLRVLSGADCTCNRFDVAERRVHGCAPHRNVRQSPHDRAARDPSDRCRSTPSQRRARSG
jgi:hypothetical protein